MLNKFLFLSLSFSILAFTACDRQQAQITDEAAMESVLFEQSVYRLNKEASVERLLSDMRSHDVLQVDEIEKVDVTREIFNETDYILVSGTGKHRDGDQVIFTIPFAGDPQLSEVYIFADCIMSCRGVEEANGCTHQVIEPCARHSCTCEGGTQSSGPEVSFPG